MAPVRTRFAPSPTGDLHLGNLRVAVFNHLFARHAGGAFILRVEDTDPERNRPGSLEGILDDLRWAGLKWDEGPDRGGDHGPYLQSERVGLHREAALRLLEKGRAYRCFCGEPEEAGGAGGRPGSGEETGEGQGPGCPGSCRELASEDVARRVAEGEEAALRFRVPEGPVEFEDEIRGVIQLIGKDIGDFVILRSDGRSTYNFAVVADDIAMEISHVIRGAGHLSNTPKHALLFDALGAPRPRFAHLPMVLGADRRKLSKREGAAGLRELREEGYHPDAVVNYLSLLGWSPGDDREVLTREELVRELTLERVGAADTVFDPEKLRWMSSQHIQAMPLEELVAAVRPFLPEELRDADEESLGRVVEALRSRISVFSDIRPALRFLLPPESVLEEGWKAVRAEGPTAVALVAGVRVALNSLEGWTVDQVDEAIRRTGKELGARGPALFHPIRLAITGERSGPHLPALLAALGREEALRRLGQVASEEGV